MDPEEVDEISYITEDYMFSLKWIALIFKTELIVNSYDYTKYLSWKRYSPIWHVEADTGQHVTRWVQQSLRIANRMAWNFIKDLK